MCCWFLNLTSSISHKGHYTYYLLCILNINEHIETMIFFIHSLGRQRHEIKKFKSYGFTVFIKSSSWSRLISLLISKSISTSPLTDMKSPFSSLLATFLEIKRVTLWDEASDLKVFRLCFFTFPPCPVQTLITSFLFLWWSWGLHRIQLDRGPIH